MATSMNNRSAPWCYGQLLLCLHAAAPAAQEALMCIQVICLHWTAAPAVFAVAMLVSIQMASPCAVSEFAPEDHATAAT